MFDWRQVPVNRSRRRYPRFRLNPKGLPRRTKW